MILQKKAIILDGQRKNLKIIISLTLFFRELRQKELTDFDLSKTSRLLIKLTQYSCNEKYSFVG